MDSYVKTYYGFDIYYDFWYDDFFIVGYPFSADYSYYTVEEAMDAIDECVYG